MGDMRIDTTASCRAADTTSDSVIFRQGDTLQSIADCNHVDLNDLMAANHLTDPNAILPGQEIRIPKGSYLPPSGSAEVKRDIGGSPNAGSVDPKSMVELKMRQSIIEGLVQKASSAGVSADGLATIASIGALPASQFNSATAAIEKALNAPDPESALTSLNRVIVQGSSDNVVVQSAANMAKGTGLPITSLAPGSLKDVGDVTLVAHGNPDTIFLGDKEYTPRQLAKTLEESGWKGGTLRLASCETGSASGAFAQRLANELEARGIDSAVIAPQSSVVIPSSTNGRPIVESLTKPGYGQPLSKGWEIFTAEGEAKGGSLALDLLGKAGSVLGKLGHVAMAADAMKTMIEGEFYYATAYGAARDNIKSEGFQTGFAEGLAASLLKESPGYVQDKVKFHAISPNFSDRVLGTEGVYERAFNSGVNEGYKFAQNLSPEVRAQVRQALAAQGNDMSDGSADNASHLMGKLLPDVKQMFDEARKALEAEKKAERERKSREWRESQGNVGNKI